MSKKITVIIPVYNAEEYLEECLNSTIGQSLKDIEIICIDDGSTDGSPEILKEYVCKDSRIKVIEEKNQGAGPARNSGIKEASGEYIAFMDADDYYPSEDVLESLYHAVCNNDVMIAGGEFSILHPNGIIDGPEHFKDDPLQFGYCFEKEGVIDYRDYQFDYGYHRFLYKKDFLISNDIAFPSLKRYQDPPFMVEAFSLAQNFYAIKKTTYVYRLSKDNKWNNLKISDLLSGIMMNVRFALDKGYTGLMMLTARRIVEEYGWAIDYSKSVLNGTAKKNYGADAKGLSLLNKMPATKKYISRRLNEADAKTIQIINGLGKLDLQINDLRRASELLAHNVQKYAEESRYRNNELEERISEGVTNSLESDEEISQALGERLEKITEDLNESKGLIWQVDCRMPEKRVFWNNAFEEKIVRENWGDVCIAPEFTEKYLRLIKGLDEESIELIQKTLSRQHKYLNGKEKKIDLYTLEEQKQLRDLDDNFRNRIFKINDNLYAYKNYLLPVNHFEASVFYYKHGLNGLDDLNKLADKDIIDVGGFVGDSVLIFNELPHKRIVSFEADPYNYELMQKTIQLNGIRNVQCENLALGSSVDTLSFHRNGAMSSLVARKGVEFYEEIQVKQVTLDSYAADNAISCGLIKVDIEGAEQAFLAGAKRTICEQKPILLISIYHNSKDFFEIKPMLESWEVGYKYSIHKPIDGNTTSEMLLIARI